MAMQRLGGSSKPKVETTRARVHSPRPSRSIRVRSALSSNLNLVTNHAPSSSRAYDVVDARPVLAAPAVTVPSAPPESPKFPKYSGLSAFNAPLGSVSSLNALKPSSSSAVPAHSGPSAPPAGWKDIPVRRTSSTLSLPALLAALKDDGDDDCRHSRLLYCQSENGISDLDTDDEDEFLSFLRGREELPLEIRQRYSAIIDFLEESDSDSEIFMVYSDREFALSETSASSDYVEEGEDNPAYIDSSEEFSSSKSGASASHQSDSDASAKKQHKSNSSGKKTHTKKQRKKKRRAGTDKSAKPNHRKTKDSTDSTDEEKTHQHKKCTQKTKHLKTKKSRRSAPAPSSNDDSSDDDDDEAQLLPKKNKQKATLSFIKENVEKFMGGGKVKYRKLPTDSSGSDNDVSAASGSEVDSSSEEETGPSWKKKTIVFLGGVALGAGGVVATMRGGGAAAAAVGGLLGLSFATNSESKIEGSDNTVVGGGSNGLFSYNYIWKPPQPGLIRSLHETNREECMRMGMVFKDPTDNAWYGWSTQHNTPACLMNVPKAMVQGYCRTLLVEEQKEGEQSSKAPVKKAQVKREIDETKEMLNRMRGKDANDEDSKEGKKWLQKSKRR